MSHMSIEDLKTMVCRNVRYMIDNPHLHTAYERLRVVFTGGDGFYFDRSDDFYVKNALGRIRVIEDNLQYGDMTSFFETREMGLHSLPWFIVLSPKTSQQPVRLAVMWDHSIADGVTAHIIFNTIVQQPIPVYPCVRPLSSVELVIASLKCIPYMRNMALPSLLEAPRTTNARYKRYKSNSLEFATVKYVSKHSGVSIPSYVLGKYITALFKILPDYVSYLKIVVPYTATPTEGTFNTLEIIPIVVYRNKSSPSDIQVLLQDCFYFSYILRNFFENENIPGYVKSVVVAGKPDVIFSVMMQETLQPQNTFTRIRIPDISVVFYGCYADGNIETTCSSPSYNISNIVL